MSNVDKSDIFQHWNDHDINYQAENEMDHRDDDDDDDDDDDGGESNFQLPTEYHINYDGDDELDVANDYEDVIDHEFEEAGNQNIIPEDYLPTFDLPEQIDDTGYDGDDELDAFSDNEDATDYEFEEAGSKNILPEDDLPIFVLSEQIDYVPQNQISNIVNNISWDQTLIENDSAYTENVEVQCMEKVNAVNILKIFSPVENLGSTPSGGNGGSYPLLFFENSEKSALISKNKL